MPVKTAPNVDHVAGRRGRHEPPAKRPTERDGCPRWPASKDSPDCSNPVSGSSQ
jgi:hypothetical protein